MPRRLLLLNTDLEIGGTPTVVRELALRLRSPEIEVEVACLGRLGPIGEALTAAGVPVTALGARGRFDIRILPRLLLLQQRRFDTVLSFLIHANALAALARTWHKSGRWFQSIQTTQPTPRWHWRVQALAARSAEKIIVPSRSVAECAMKWANVSAEKLVVIPNAVEVEMESLPIFPRPNEELRVGFIGRLDPVKRIGDLVAALPLLGPGYRLDIYGEGAERRRIESQVARLGLTEHVRVHAGIARPREALASMDVLVLPSLAEGFGLVLIEAMAAGVPVVATDAPGIRDVVEHRRTGLLVPIGDISQLAAAIRSVRDDPSACRERVEEARREVKQLYTWNRVIPMYRVALGLD